MRKFDKGGKLTVLSDEGTPQMKIEGGNRIYSRASTKKIIEMATSAASDEDYIALGQYVIKETIAQNKRKEENIS